MVVAVRRLEPRDVDAVVALSLRAWEPVFASLAQVLGAGLLRRLHPDWRVDQERAVRDVCADPAMMVFVAEVDDAPVGFVAVTLDEERSVGEIDMVAVDLSHQRRGIGRRLTDLAVEQLREAGMQVAMVETGGDPGHAPARATYEDAGFTLLPVSRYFKAL